MILGSLWDNFWDPFGGHFMFILESIWDQFSILRSLWEVDFPGEGFLPTYPAITKVQFFPQHYVEGLLNSRPRVESVHTEIAIFAPPPCTGRIIIGVSLHTETLIKKSL